MNVSDTINLIVAGINLVVAGATLALAFAAFKTIKENKKSIEAAQRSAAATEASLERMKDTLTPYFDLGLKWDKSPILTIRNTGPGLGKIRLVTVRNDITFESILNPVNYWPQVPPLFNEPKGQNKINDFVIGSKEEFSFQLERNQIFSPTGDKSWISSLSVYYEDVYERVFRSRIIYTMDSPQNIKVKNKENITESLPLNTFSNFDVQNIYNLEGESPVSYWGEFLEFHSLRLQKAIENVLIQGTKLTNEQDLRLLGLEFNKQGFPAFRVKVGIHDPLKLSRINDTYDRPKYLINTIIDGEITSYSEYG